MWGRCRARDNTLQSAEAEEYRFPGICGTSNGIHGHQERKTQKEKRRETEGKGKGEKEREMEHPNRLGARRWPSAYTPIS